MPKLFAMISLHKKIKYVFSIAVAMAISTQTVLAADGPAPSIFNNILALSLLALMVLLLIIIGILGNILIGAADYKSKKAKVIKMSSKVITSFLLLISLGITPSLLAQDTNVAKTTEVSSTIGGMAASTFYLMATVIFLELVIIIVMLINIKFLLRKEREEVASAEELEEIRKTRLTWWDKINKMRPVSQEAELDLGHEYDGIRELNNRLPPWWLYGFYVTIIVAVIYLWRFHISHTGPSSKEEYDRSVTAAEMEIKEYLAKKGDAVDENTVTLLTEAQDITEGKRIFTTSCASCHKETGAGDVGPNLTDDYWLHGSDIKSVFKTIRYGINAMPQWQNQYSNKQIAQVASYVKSLHGSNPANPKAPQGVLQKEDSAPVADTVSAEKKVAMN